MTHSLTLWLSKDVIDSWNPDLNQRMGRPKLYSDLAIEIALTLRLLFKLPLRQTEGFLKSIFRLMNIGKIFQITRLYFEERVHLKLSLKGWVPLVEESI